MGLEFYEGNEHWAHRLLVSGVFKSLDPRYVTLASKAGWVPLQAVERPADLFSRALFPVEMGLL